MSHAIACTQLDPIQNPGFSMQSMHSPPHPSLSPPITFIILPIGHAPQKYLLYTHLIVCSIVLSWITNRWLQ